MPTQFEFGAAVQDLFSRGIDAFKDIEVSKNYAANDSRPATRAANGAVIPQGEPGTGLAAAVAGNPLLLAAVIGVVGGLIVYLIARRL